MNNSCFIVSVIKTIFLILYAILKSWVSMVTPSQWRSKSVRNNVVLITGAGSGLGAALAVKFAKLKARIVLWDINSEGLNSSMEQCRQFQSESCIFTFVVDVTDRKQVLETAEKIKSDIGFVDILINNAGVVAGKGVFDLTPQMVERTFKVNVFSHFWTVQAFLPQMMTRDSGHIVSIASVAGHCGVSKLTDYCASKYAAIGFQEALRSEIYAQKKYGIKTLTVCPFYINTGMFSGVQADSPILKILDVDFAASKIEEAILTNASYLMMPRITYFLVFLKSFITVDGFAYLGELVGASTSMDSFIGQHRM